MYKMRKSIFAVLTLVTLLCSCAPANNIGTQSELKVSVLKVGQADAIILKTQNHIAVIDCGEEDDGDEILEYISSYNADSIDYLFITHFDKDHVGGAAQLLESVNIKNIITPNYEGTNKEYRKYLSAAADKGYTPLKLTEETSFVLDDVTFDIYPPLKSSYSESDNDFSLAISVTHGENRFLFTGDAEEERLKEILSQTEGEFDFLKVPHHGIYAKNTEEFLRTINPKYAVITCSEKNPADEFVLQILEKYGCKTYLTSSGNVEISSNGKNIKIFQ